MRSSVALGVTGFSLIAITYGMARFAWGLMMPAVMKDIPFSPRLSGIITACSYLAYCLATLAAAWLVARLGSKRAAMAAALCAAAGLLVLASSDSPTMLAAGLFIAGLSAGIASPSLAGAVTQGVALKRQDFANTAINAGTSAGIILSVPVVLMMPGGWRAACLAFSLMAVACLFPLCRYLPAHRPTENAARVGGWRDQLLQRAMVRLMIIAFFSGCASAAWWSFGPDVLRRYLHVDEQASSLLWLISGGAGIFGILTRPIARYLSMRQLYRLTQLCMAAGLIVLAASHGFAWQLFAVSVLSGAGYVTLSGLLLVYGAASVQASPATGVSAAFFMLAAGQVTGSVMFGQLYAGSGAAAALLAFAGVSLLTMLLAPTENGGVSPHERRH